MLQGDYGRRSPHLARERWFPADTAEGGADKLGHFYTAQALARGMASLYRGWGLAPAAAARGGGAAVGAGHGGSGDGGGGRLQPLRRIRRGHGDEPGGRVGGAGTGAAPRGAGWRLQLGYYARGYDQPLAPERRVPYAPLGLNLPLLFRRAGLPRLAGFLQFYQPPDSSLRVEDPR